MVSAGNTPKALRSHPPIVERLLALLRSIEVATRHILFVFKLECGCGPPCS
jgi:hypothetical protein